MKELIYSNPFKTAEDVKDFVLEGSAIITFDNDRMRLKNKLSGKEYGQKANYVFWCPVEFPDGIQMEWDFYPIEEPGLCMMMYSAKGNNGEDIFDEKLRPRDGDYGCYLFHDLNLYHVSYFRRGSQDERSFHICQLRKSRGGNKLEAGGDPIPNIEDCDSPYHMTLSVKDGHIKFFINDLKIIDYIDDGVEYGEILRGGKIGFRQMAPTVGEYANFNVYKID